jgi:hypothetical protein
MNQGTPPPDVFSFWVISDIFEEGNLSGTSAFAGAMGMILRQRDAKKPSYNAFKMLHMLGDSTLSLTGGTTADKGLNGIATFSKDKSKVQILVYDHTYGSGANPAFATTMDTVHLQIKNLPFLPGQMKVERYGVDKNHSNSFTTWVNQGRPAKPSSAQWDELAASGELKKLDSTTTVNWTGGTFTKVYPQAQPGVSLLVLTGEVPVGLAPQEGSSGPRNMSLRASAVGNALSISYSLHKRMPVRLTVTDSRGRIVATAVDAKDQAAGEHRIQVPALPIGTYLCVLRSGDAVLRSAPLVILR